MTGKKKANREQAERKLSQMDAAVKVLARAREPMSCREMVEAMTKRGLWQSPGGKTPEATLYASILRDLRKGNDARFQKSAPGRFMLNR
jgi:hypothetical protein